MSGVSLVRGGNLILNGVDLKIERGQHWALIGPNGSGKTALLNLIAAYLWPTTGSVRVLGSQLGAIDVRELRKRIGLVSSALFDRVPASQKLADVVLSGRFASLGLYDRVRQADREQAREILSLIGCTKLSGRPYGVLSFGERQRALIGRALAANPELLLLDEPCEGLDLAGRETLLALVDRLTSRPDGPTLIFVTHRVEEIAPGISHALVLNAGRVKAAGEKKSVLTGEVLSRALGVAVTVEIRNGRYYAFAGE